MTETTQLGLPIYSDNDIPLWTNTNDGFEALDSLVNSCSAVKLNWSTPLHQFTNGNLTYTATKDCWLVGNHGETAVGTLSINGNIITQANSGFAYFIPPLPLRKGDIVTVQDVESQLYVLEGELVSGNTYVFNEAQVTLDYAHPLHRFSVGGSYTATQDCWLVGSGSNLAVTIDGTRIGDSTSQNYVNIPPTKLVAGQTVTTSGSATALFLYVLKGTVTGSVGVFKREVQRNYYFALKYGAPVDIDISSLKNTEEITITVSYMAGNSCNGERVSVSTAKTYNAHILEAQTNIGTSITYANGKLQFVASNTTYSVIVWVTFN